MYIIASTLKNENNNNRRKKKISSQQLKWYSYNWYGIDYHRLKGFGKSTKWHAIFVQVDRKGRSNKTIDMLFFFSFSNKFLHLKVTTNDSYVWARRITVDENKLLFYETETQTFFPCLLKCISFLTTTKWKDQHIHTRHLINSCMNRYANMNILLVFGNFVDTPKWIDDPNS